MADFRLEVLYLAPSDPVRTPIAQVARGFLAALRKAEGIGVRPLLTPDCPDGAVIKADPMNEASQRYAAGWLHRQLEGYEGTAGDVLEYLRMIQTFAD